MKKGLTYFVVILTVLSICSVNVKAANVDGYICKKISVSGKYSDTNNKNSYKKIIRSYKDLVKLKKYIKKNCTGETSIILNPDNAVTIVCIPASAKKTKKHGKLIVDGEIVDYRL